MKSQYINTDSKDFSVKKQLVTLGVSDSDVQIQIRLTVGEKIIATTKIQNNYGAIQSSILR